MSRRKMIYEGKAKIIYEGPDPSTVIQYFKDDEHFKTLIFKDVKDIQGVPTAMIMHMENYPIHFYIQQPITDLLKNV